MMTEKLGEREKTGGKVRLNKPAEGIQNPVRPS